MTKNNWVKIFFVYYFPILFWMGLIFCLSSLEGNGVKSNPDLWFYVKRKGAHVFEYIILTLLIARVTLLHINKKADFIKALFLAGAVSFMYAFSDEIHQVFVHGREGKLLDIGIDSVGILIGIFIVFKFHKNKFIKRFLV